ncbi:ATP-binding protein [Cupriavidus agavae]|uniref:Virulence sensor protein BvgS n=1 Tax=Cupriavidus agavae TaxID=1001822 RepID=A0A4Q7RU20_9BURK|nr:ATP-binding protein [Cupriavidus agavae]RZT36310.1 two-component system capsular synthesis sensor histidine kinase RcsC [Cupriavidus agavae]
MQQILDRTQESLSQSFETLAANARRQQKLYYVTVALLVAIVMVSALLLAGLAAARHLDVRRGHVAQYVSAISLQLQGESSFLRRTALTLHYFLGASAPTSPDPVLLADLQRDGVAVAADRRFVILMPASTRHALGRDLPERLWQLQQIATATLTTQTAFGLDHLAYVVDSEAAYAIVLSPSPLSDSALALLGAERLAGLRDIVRPRGGTDAPQWIGPITDPITGQRAIVTAGTAAAPDGQVAIMAASVPVASFLAGLKRPSDPATLLLVGHDGTALDVSPPMAPDMADRILAQIRRMSVESIDATARGMLLNQPLGEFGSLVYALSYRTLLAAITTELAVIGAIAALLIVAIVLAARYWDIHLLRRSHAEAARALDNETINHILVSATPVGLCIVRQRDRLILTSNMVADTLLGCSQGASLPAHIAEAMQTPRSISQITVPAGPADPPRFLSMTYAPVRYRNEDVLFCAVQDVTAQHQLEHQLREAREAAEAMMRARSNFFASMSHEIRTPLNALLGNLELLARADGMAAQAPRLRALQVASDGLRRIVNDILDFSKIDAGEMKLVNEPFRPIDDLENLAMSYAPMVADRPTRFYVHLSPTLDMALLGDRTRIAQIVSNLLSNAVKFTSCGKIVLSAEVATDTEGRNVLVCRVRDSGIGMPPALVARVFQPFVQGEASTSARYGGTGLGLSICARLTEMMGGHIAVESVEGVGTAFSFAIPLPAIDGEPARHEPEVQGSRAMILCQEVESGTMLGAWLERAGWRVQTFHQPAAAQAWLRNNRPHILMVTGEYDLATVTELRRIHAANAVWITLKGPERPVKRQDGVYEVTAFSHTALLASAIAALDDEDIGGAGSMAPAEPEPAESGETARNGVPPTGQTILVAEDNPLNQMLIAEQLESLGWRPQVAGDGRQALDVLRQQPGRIDAVLTDIHMPIMDGYALLAAIRSSWPDLPVLAFSAVTDGGQAGDWQARGFTGYVAKPASLASLGAALAGIPAQAAGTAEEAPEASPFPPAELERYRGILRDHLQHDEPELAAIMVRKDVTGLRHWAHRSAGAFLVVAEHGIVGACRLVERLAHDTAGDWPPELDAAALVMQDAVRQFREAGRGTPAGAMNPARSNGADPATLV